MLKAFNAGKDFIVDLTDQDTYELKKSITDDDVIRAAQKWTAQLQLESQVAIDETIKSFIAGAGETETRRRMVLVQSNDITNARKRGEPPVQKPPLGKFRNFDD